MHRLSVGHNSLSFNRKKLIFNLNMRHESLGILRDLGLISEAEVGGLGFHSPQLPCDQQTDPTLQCGASHSRHTCPPALALQVMRLQLLIDG